LLIDPGRVAFNARGTWNGRLKFARGKSFEENPMTENFGHFDEARREYVITNPLTPEP